MQTNATVSIVDCGPGLYIKGRILIYLSHTFLIAAKGSGLTFVCLFHINKKDKQYNKYESP